MSSAEPTKDEEEDISKGVAEPRETDVLCGRGGAALRHAGNQTYRRLVNLNKGLYITCMKTEKLKISRSIVAAIREQKGRFLERDAKKGVWFDIGDKKAVEKTSQALREGQPKLRKQMVARGQIPPDNAAGGMELRMGGNGIYNARTPSGNSQSLDSSMHRMLMNMNNGMGSGMSVNSNSIGSLGRMGSVAPSVGSGGSGSTYSSMYEMQKQQMMMRGNNSGQFGNNMGQMPPPPMRTLSTSTNMNSMNSLSMASMGNNNDMNFQKLSLEPQSIPSWTPSIGSIESLMTMSTTEVPQMVSRRNLSSRQYNNRNPSYGSNNNNHNNSNNHNVHTMQSITSNSTVSTTSNNLNNLSDFGMTSNFSNNTNNNNSIEPNFLTEKIGSFDPTEQPRLHQQMQQMQQQQQFSSNSGGQMGYNDNNMNNMNNMNNNMNDQRQANGPSVNDRRRYFAKMKYNASSPRALSNRKSIHDGMPDIHMVDSQFSLLSNLSTHGSKHRGNTDMDISKHGGILAKKDSMGSEYIGVGSRRSLMSGMSQHSKLSGHSEDINNPFGNLGKKITSTNHTLSSRSLTMSEFSGVEEEFAEDDFNFDIPTQP